MRFSQGRWAEDILIRTINATEDFRAIPYGPSSVAPSDPREMELYFERLDKAGAIGKQPDLLILPKADYEAIRLQLDDIGLANLPFTPEEDLTFLRSRAIAAAEVENSLWVARMMPDYGKSVKLTELIAKTRRFRKAESKAKWEAWTRNVRRFIDASPERKELQGFLESKKVPTIIIKDEDLGPLTEWESSFNPEARYIQHGEALGLHQRSLVKTRSLWYAMEQRDPAPIYFTYLSRKKSRFIYNQVDVLALNVFLCIYPMPAIGQDEMMIKSLLAVLNSLVAKDSLRYVGRSYGGDTIKIEPREMDRLPVLNPLRLAPQEREKLAELFDCLCQADPDRDEKTIRQAIDEAIAAMC
ncbi:MAG TPA: AccI family restriction endonuclease [Anaerolineae bacterium]|nr:AccI family restriction endonuclease [Anaerolineae bacterium]